MYRIIDSEDFDLFTEVVFSTLDKAREYAKTFYTELGIINFSNPAEYADIGEMEDDGTVSFMRVLIDPLFLV